MACKLHRFVAVPVACWLALCLSPTFAATIPTHVDILPVTTRTVPESDLLRGTASRGDPVAIGTEVAIPLEAQGRVPAVLPAARLQGRRDEVTPGR